jgi:hypothetical protein
LLLVDHTFVNVLSCHVLSGVLLRPSKHVFSFHSRRRPAACFLSSSSIYYYFLPIWLLLLRSGRTRHIMKPVRHTWLIATTDSPTDSALLKTMAGLEYVCLYLCLIRTAKAAKVHKANRLELASKKMIVLYHKLHFQIIGTITFLTVPPARH